MAQTLTPTGTVTLDAGWAVVAAGSAHAALSDGADASYIIGNTEGDVAEVALTAGTLPGAPNLHRLWWRTRRFGASPGPVLLDVSLVEGAVVRATHQHTQPIGVGFAWYSYDLTPAEYGAVSNYADLRLRFVDAQTVGAVEHIIAEGYVELSDPAPPPGTQPSTGDRTAIQAGKRAPLVQVDGVQP